MFDIIASITILSVLYFLFIRGFIYRWICWMFGVIGMYLTFNNIHILQRAPILIFDHQVQWSIIIAFIITLLAIITTKIKK